MYFKQEEGPRSSGRNPFFVVFRIHENSGPSREVCVDFGLLTTVNEGAPELV